MKKAKRAILLSIILIVLLVQAVNAQTITFTLTVLDGDDLPISGQTIELSPFDGTPQLCTTDERGHCSWSVAPMQVYSASFDNVWLDEATAAGVGHSGLAAPSFAIGTDSVSATVYVIDGFFYYERDQKPYQLTMSEIEGTHAETSPHATAIVPTIQPTPTFSHIAPFPTTQPTTTTEAEMDEIENTPNPLTKTIGDYLINCIDSFACVTMTTVSVICCFYVTKRSEENA